MAGAPARIGQTAQMALCRAGGATTKLPSKVRHTAVRAGDRFVCAGPAGGGYGDPFTRDPARVLADVLDELITPDMARQDFGVAIATGAVDTAPTAKLRQRWDPLPPPGEGWIAA